MGATALLFPTPHSVRSCWQLDIGYAGSAYTTGTGKRLQSHSRAPPLPPEGQLLNIHQCTSAAGGPEARVGGNGDLTEGGVSTGVKVKLAEHADALNMKSEIKT